MSKRILTLTRQGEAIYYSGPHISEAQYGGRTIEEALLLAKSRRLYDPKWDTINDLTAYDPHNLVTPDDTNKPRTHAERVATAKCYHDVIYVPEGAVAFEWELAGTEGGRFTLLPEAHHTPEDVEKAKRSIKKNREVVGRIRVIRPTHKGNP